MFIIYTFIFICIAGIVAQLIRNKYFGKPKQCNCRNCVMSRNPSEGYAPCMYGDKDARS